MCTFHLGTGFVLDIAGQRGRNKENTQTIIFLLNKVCACVYNKRDIFKKVKFYKHVYSNTIN